MTEAAKVETLESVEADLDANVAAIGDAVERLHALYRAEIEKLEGEIEDARNERDKVQAMYDDAAEALSDILPGEFDTYAALAARIEGIFDVFDDMREVVQTVEPLLGGFSDEDSMETVGLRAVIRRLADRLR